MREPSIMRVQFPPDPPQTLSESSALSASARTLTGQIRGVPDSFGFGTRLFIEPSNNR